MAQIGFVVFAIIFFVFYADTNQSNYELILENVTTCVNPQPPYSNKRTFLSEFHIHKQGRSILVSGQHKLLEEVPFLNFTAQTFTISASGTRKLILQANKINCRGWRGKLFLKPVGFRVNNDNCRIQRGTYQFRGIDVNKTIHTVPCWHAAGRQLQKLFLTFNGSTIFCFELMLLFVDL